MGKNKLNSSSGDAQVKLKKVFQLGLEIGYFNHSESLAWVEDEKEEIFGDITDSKFISLLLKKYEEGKLFGKEKAAKDRAKALNSTLGMIDDKKHDKPVRKDPTKDDSHLPEHLRGAHELDPTEDEGGDIGKTLETIRELFDKDARFRVYKEALDQAWKDGSISADEQNLLNRLQDELGMMNTLRDVFQEGAVGEDSFLEGIATDDRERVYSELLKEAWRDGMMTYEEEEILESIRIKLDIGVVKHHELYHMRRREWRHNKDK